MYIGLSVKKSNQTMAIHLSGNMCHGYGRAYIRTQLEATPQNPHKKKQDLDHYICQVDIMILMMFSNFYKQRIMPNEIFDFFYHNKKNAKDVYVDANLEYLNTRHSEEMDELHKEIEKIQQRK